MKHRHDMPVRGCIPLHRAPEPAAFAWQLMPLRLGLIGEPALILLGTVTGCALLHEFVIPCSDWLRPLFGFDARRTLPRMRMIMRSAAEEIA